MCVTVRLCVCVCVWVSERQTPICPGNALKPDIYSGGKQGRQGSTVNWDLAEHSQENLKNNYDKKIYILC